MAVVLSCPQTVCLMGLVDHASESFPLVVGSWCAWCTAVWRCYWSVAVSCYSWKSTSLCSIEAWYTEEAVWPLVTSCHQTVSPSGHYQIAILPSHLPLDSSKMELAKQHPSDTLLILYSTMVLERPHQIMTRILSSELLFQIPPLNHGSKVTPVVLHDTIKLRTSHDTVALLDYRGLMTEWASL